ncbi:MAG TPA: glycoside hydrolase family 30 protein [Candidatus Acidoferrum sp.]|nr:glycoside hydrolase family 30 protein [Candidatus Acidoferrum sp.]
METTRRDFLKMTASLSAAVAAADAKPLYAQSDTVPGTVHAWRTSALEKFQPLQSPPQWETGQDLSALAIYLDPATAMQEVLGFGGAFTDASCYLISRLSPDARHEFLSNLYGPSGLRLSIGRTCIGTSDYSTKMYSYDDTPEPDPELAHFSIDKDRAWIIPTLRQAQEINPDLYLFSCVWSPPGWMKSGGSMLGGCMKERWLATHAQYFVKFLQAYADAGVKVRAVTVNNEVDTDQDGHFPATLWAQQLEAAFVAFHLGPALEKASLRTKIWILDHNYDLWGRAGDELSKPEVAKYVDGVAWHSYIGTPDAMTRVHDMFPDKHMYFTEGGPPAHLFRPPDQPSHYFDRPGYGTDWTRWSTAFTDMLRNWARCICVWNLLLDENGRPDITTPPRPMRRGGLVSVDSKTKQLTYSGNYYAFPHYSKLIQRGAHVFSSSGELPGVHHVAAENPDQSRVLVLTNTNNAEQQVDCRLSSRVLKVVLPPDSITSLVWS